MDVISAMLMLTNIKNWEETSKRYFKENLVTQGNFG